MIENDSSRVRRNKYGELWSTNEKVIGVNVNKRNKWTFSRDYISALGELAPQIFTCARD